MDKHTINYKARHIKMVTSSCSLELVPQPDPDSYEETAGLVSVGQHSFGDMCGSITCDFKAEIYDGKKLTWKGAKWSCNYDTYAN